MSSVTDYPAAAPDITAAYYLQKLSFETDCSDVHAAIQGDDIDFVLLHVVGSEQTFARRHLPGAIHLPHRFITEARLAEWPDDTLFVVYCAGPHCNGADRAALKLAQLGRRVKVMPGGIAGWADEGLAFA